MATYKVLQDIEAEDKLFGPFTLKQFIFGGICAVIIFILFQVLVSPMPVFLKTPVVAVFIPPLAVFGFLAAPISRDQPNDIWLLARLRFLFKPRVRIWNQDGISDLVTINVPKRDTHIYTNSLSQTEVKSRLQALASTVDTRGWAVKNVETNLFAQPGYLTDATGSDRLVDPSELPQETAIVNVAAADDILDPLHNERAQNLDRLIKESTATHRQQAIAHMSSPAASPQPATQTQTPQDFWFMNQPAATAPVPGGYTMMGSNPVVQPGAQDDVAAPVQATAEEEALAHKIAEQKKETLSSLKDRMRVITPMSEQKAAPAPVQAPMVPAPEPSIDPATVQRLAQNNDLNITTIAHEAKAAEKKQDDGEVVISLH